MKKIGKNKNTLNSVVASENIENDNFNNKKEEANVNDNANVNINNIENNNNNLILSNNIDLKERGNVEKVVENIGHVQEILDHPFLGKRFLDVENMLYYDIYKVYKYGSDIFFSIRSEKEDITISKQDLDNNILISKFVLIEDNNEYVDFKEEYNDVFLDKKNTSNVTVVKNDKNQFDNEQISDDIKLFKEIYVNAVKRDVKIKISVNMIDKNNMKNILKVFNNKENLLDYIIKITIDDNISSIKEQLKKELNFYYLDFSKKE